MIVSMVERIESGEVGLEASLKEYETGMALIAHCRTILSAAEQKIAELTVTSRGELAAEAGGDDDVEEVQPLNTDGEDDLPI